MEAIGIFGFVVWKARSLGWIVAAFFPLSAEPIIQIRAGWMGGCLVLSVSLHESCIECTRKSTVLQMSDRDCVYVKEAAAWMCLVIDWTSETVDTAGNGHTRLTLVLVFKAPVNP